MRTDRIYFLVSGRKKEFVLHHDLDEQGVNIRNEVAPWLNCTKERSKQSFRRFLKEKYENSFVL